ncbi:MAG: hypothetical protein ACTHJ4_01985 [Candidatus Nucleicultricaceae bacterium]
MLKTIKLSLLTSLLLTAVPHYTFASLVGEDDTTKAPKVTVEHVTVEEDKEKGNLETVTHSDVGEEEGGKEKLQAQTHSAEDEKDVVDPGYQLFMNIVQRLDDINPGDVRISGQEWFTGWVPDMKDAFYYMDLESAVTKAEKITKNFNIKTDFTAYQEVEQKVAMCLNQKPAHEFTNVELNLVSQVIFGKQKLGVMKDVDRVLATKVMFYRTLNSLALRLIGSFQILQLQVSIQDSLEREELRRNQETSVPSSSSSVSVEVGTEKPVVEKEAEVVVETTTTETPQPQGKDGDAQETHTPSDDGVGDKSAL